MLRNIIQAVFLAIVLASCQREVGTIQRTNDTGLLVKTILISGSASDSTTTVFDYDSNDRLIRETYTFKYHFTVPASTLPKSTEFIRDMLGRVTRIKATGYYINNPSLEINGYANVIYTNNTSVKVAYLTDDNGSSKDVFFYTNDGKVSKTEMWEHYPLPADPLKVVTYFTYRYDGTGNLIEKIQYSDFDNNGSFEKALTYRFEYDGKVNPYNKKEDAFLEAWWSVISPQNFTKQSNDYADPLSLDDQVTQQFTYRTDGRPIKAIITGTSGDQSVMSFFYQ